MTDEQRQDYLEQHRAHLEDGCGGMHVLYCECGGDNLCVCHHHGVVECPGCEDCEDDFDEEEGDWE